MLLRVSTVRNIIILSFITVLIYKTLFQWLFPTVHIENTANIQVDRFYSSNVKENKPSLPHSPIYNEFVDLHFRPLRISPTELDKPTTQRECVSEVLPYNDEKFRKSSTPILWLDDYGDIRWNKAAEEGMISYLTKKQFPNLDKMQGTSLNKKELLDTCRPGSVFIMHQHWSGFFSRVLCFIAQFGQTLHTPRIAVLRGSRFSSSRGESDDFLGEGITRYFLPVSICSAYENHPNMGELRDLIEKSPDALHIARTKQLYEQGAAKSNRLILSMEYWKMDYHHVPIRKWLFDRKNSSVSYDSPVHVLADHSDEHIYAPKNEKDYPIGEWINTNKPDAFSSDLLPDDGKYKLTWKDYVFGGFLRYMFVLYFGSQNAPHIEHGVRVLAQFWKSYLTSKYGVGSNASVFDNLVGLYIRRGDKSVEDSFWHKHHHWRNLSYYVKGIVDAEKRFTKSFKYVFVMTDDVSVMSSLQEYADPQSSGQDERYARENLRGREILYNVLAPQPCFDPFRRIGFEQFLVSMRFLIDNAAYTVGHTDSNVFRFFREIVFARRQHQPKVQTNTFVGNAPDSF